MQDRIVAFFQVRKKNLALLLDNILTILLVVKEASALMLDNNVAFLLVVTRVSGLTMMPFINDTYSIMEDTTNKRK